MSTYRQPVVQFFKIADEIFVRKSPWIYLLKKITCRIWSLLSVTKFRIKIFNNMFRVQPRVKLWIPKHRENPHIIGYFLNSQMIKINSFLGALILTEITVDGFFQVGEKIFWSQRKLKFKLIEKIAQICNEKIFYFSFVEKLCCYSYSSLAIIWRLARL